MLSVSLKFYLEPVSVMGQLFGLLTGTGAIEKYFFKAFTDFSERTFLISTPKEDGILIHLCRSVCMSVCLFYEIPSNFSPELKYA